MRAAGRLALFGAGMAVVFAAAAAAGNAVGPGGMPDADTAAHGTTDTHAPAATPGAGSAHGDEHGSTPAAAKAPGGLQSASEGFRLALDSSELAASPRAPLSFKVIGPDGHPLTAYTRAHDKDLHLIVVRRDLSGYQHVHPQLGADGTWRVPVDLHRPGQWRVIADFDPAGPVGGLVLGADVAVAGPFAPQPLPAPAPATEVDGYTVAVSGGLRAAKPSPVTFSLAHRGRPVADLQPYLAAYGHLVVLREGDLAYVHAHPSGTPGDGVTAPGPSLGFTVETPSAGRYRLYLDFQHAGQVRTAEFTAVAPDGDGHGH